jgi:endonuclease YncB( thermonuclease family)
MTRSLRWLLLSLMFLLHGLCVANELEGRVVGVMDGDTIDLLTDNKELVRVRLSGIDAPEKRQPFGQAAKGELSDLAYNRRATVDWAKKDRYGRVIGKLFVSGRDANLQMVQRGLAWHYKTYQKEQPLQDRQAYARAEDDARVRHLGLWIDKEPTAPWDFRRRGKERVEREGDRKPILAK